MPESIAWFFVIHLFFGAAGLYCYCRLIGASHVASFLAGLIFAVSPENASLINAGHIMKIATMSFAPWCFYFLEKGFQTRRIFFFLTTALVLAFQFFNIHWQISYYTCLGIGLYGVIRSGGIVLKERMQCKKELVRLIGLNLVVVLFFLTTVGISLVPLASWSKDTNRGNPNSITGKTVDGLDREEAMSWSLPPEEVSAFVIPGFFGYSLQKEGENPANILAYYWGRMRFSQTVSYMGLLPWLLLPLPLIFRRDRYTWLALISIVGGILFSMGKYTPFYNLLFDYFPGINRFRVPKMIMFIPVMGLGVIAARGIDILCDRMTITTRQFKQYHYGIIALPVILIILLLTQYFGQKYWFSMLSNTISSPSKFEQGQQLLSHRWINLRTETVYAIAIAATSVAAIFAYTYGKLTAKMVPLVLIAIYLMDTGRVNSKFQFLVNSPNKFPQSASSIIQFLSKESKEYRVLPMDGSDSMMYISNNIPVVYRFNPVQKQRWQNYLDSFNLMSAMPDLMNIKYLIYETEKYELIRDQLDSKYIQVFQTPDRSRVILENTSVLPKAWLIPCATVNTDRLQTFSSINNLSFNPRKMAIVESLPPFSLGGVNNFTSLPPQNVSVSEYGSERIIVNAVSSQNSLLVLGEKYYEGWRAFVDGNPSEIYPVDHVLRGVYLQPGIHKIEFVFDPKPYKIGKWMTFVSLTFFACMFVRESSGRPPPVSG